MDQFSILFVLTQNLRDYPPLASEFQKSFSKLRAGQPPAQMVCFISPGDRILCCLSSNLKTVISYILSIFTIVYGSTASPVPVTPSGPRAEVENGEFGIVT